MISARYKLTSEIGTNLSPKQKESIEMIKGRNYEYYKYSCPICKHDKFEKLSEKDRFGLRADIVICTDCGLIMTNPRMTEEAYKDFYKNFYRSIYNKGDGAVEIYFRKQYERGQRIANFIENFFGEKLTNKKILEIGCGAGGILQKFKEDGNEVSGIDLGAEFLAYGIKKNLDLRVSTLQEERIPSQKYDILIFSHVLEHLPDVKSQLKIARKFLNKNGLIYIEVPGIKNMWMNLNFDFLDYIQNAHIWHFTKRTLNNMVDNLELNVLSQDEHIHMLLGLSSKVENVQRESDYKSARRYIFFYEFLFKIKIQTIVNFIRRIWNLIKRFPSRFSKKSI